MSRLTERLTKGGQPYPTQLGQHVVLPLPRQSPRESRLAFTLQFYLNTCESESVLVARVGLPRGRSDAASSYLSPDDATGQPSCHSHELPRLFVSEVCVRL